MDAFKMSRAWLPGLVALGLTSMFLLLPGTVIEHSILWLQTWWPTSPDELDSGEEHIDKLIHVFLFGLCGYLICKQWIEVSKRLVLLYAVLFAYAILTEVLQNVIPGRGASAGDLAADGLGLLFGIYGAVLRSAKNKTG